MSLPYCLADSLFARCKLVTLAEYNVVIIFPMNNLSLMKIPMVANTAKTIEESPPYSEITFGIVYSVRECSIF